MEFIVRLIHFFVKGLIEKQAALKQHGKACSLQVVLVRAFPKDDPQRPPLYLFQLLGQVFWQQAVPD